MSLPGDETCDRLLAEHNISFPLKKWYIFKILRRILKTFIKYLQYGLVEIAQRCNSSLVVGGDPDGLSELDIFSGEFQ